MMLATVLFWISSCLLILSSMDIATAQRYGDLRLVRFSSTISSYSYGRLEIYINGRWGTVCDDSFSSSDARVACRQLGFSSGSITFNSYGSGSGQIWLDDVGCSGIESCLLSCSNNGIGVHNCRHSDDVAISCSGIRFTSADCSRISTTVCTSSQFRCDNGQCVSSSVRCNGATGGCSDGSDERGCSSCQSGAFRCSNRQCIRSTDRCDGTRDCTDGSDEIGCTRCTSSQFRCDNGQCVSSSVRCNGVTGGCSDGSDERGCSTARRSGDLRLAQSSRTSSSYSYGRLEIYINGQWGTVCEDSFTSSDARVACRQLGFSSGSTTFNSYGSGSGPIWLDNLGCSGSESCLLSCSNNGIGVHNCDHSEDVAISCSGTSFSTTYCSNTALPTVYNSIVSIAVGVSVAGFVLFVVIPIVCVVIACCCQARRRPRTVVTTTTPAPTAETTTVVTTSQQQAAYTQSYPAAGTEKQAPPPAYTAHPIEMSAYPPPGAYPPQGGYPPPPQGGYPPPPQGGYPPQ